jgi:ribosomal-protein-alanine N-acetyltransferase
MAVTRLAEESDAEALAALLTASREFLAPWEPIRSDSYFTAEGQREILVRQLGEHTRSLTLPLVITDTDGTLAGRISMNGITGGALQSATVGYWVSETRNGRGLATAAVADVIAIAFGELGLHRLQAETLPHNAASQRVLAKNGFRPFAVAPSYLRIAGSWRDMILYHLLNDNWAA